MATKTGYLKNSIAKATGYYTAKGEKLKGAVLSQEQQDAWNGVVKKAAKAKKPKVDAVVEQVVSEEVVQPVVEEVAQEETEGKYL
jgi:hypothetical protein